MNRTRLALAIVLSAMAVPPSGAEQRRVDTRRTPVVEVFERTRDSIVNISSTTTTMLRYRRSPFGLGIFDEIFEVPTKSTNLGSGFIIHKSGYIVTNAHVVARAMEHTVTFANGDEYEAEIVAGDSEHDLAVLKIEPKPSLRLRPIEMGRSDDLMTGETAIAIGNPVGLQHTVTTGVISALHRDVEFRSGVTYRNLIQTDASINPGNSGGPLLNIHGELIGINTAIRGDAQNIGFAIPVGRLRELLPGMLDIEKRHRVDVGLRVSGAEEARVAGIREGSPADEAGLRKDDVLTEVDGTPIKRGVDFYIAMLGRRAGDEVPMRLRRGDRVKNVTLRLREVPKAQGARLAYDRYGMKLEELGRDTARKLGIRTDMGVLVASVDRHGPADHAGIRPGDLLVQLGRLRVRNLSEVGSELASVREGEAKYIVIWRFFRRGNVDAYEGSIHAR